MLIGELSKKAQLSRDTIRFYEKKGLIKAKPSASEYNTYKNYTEENLQRIIVIKKAKTLGFTLKELREMLDLVEVKQASCAVMEKKVQEKLEAINLKIKELEHMKSLIYARIEETSSTCIGVQPDENCRF